MTDANSTDGRPAYPPGEHPDLPPPPGTVGWIGWVRERLFSGWLNTLLTLAAIYVLYAVVTSLFDWSVVRSVVSGSDRRLCDLGRTASLLGERVSAVNWVGLDEAPPASGAPEVEVQAYEVRSRAAQNSLNAATGILGDLNDRLKKSADVLPPVLAERVAAIDPQGLMASVDGAVTARDWPAAQALLAETQPISEWGEGFDGACWVVIKERINQFIFGFYPRSQQWRPILFFVLLVAAMAPILAPNLPYRRRLAWFTVAFPFLAAILLYGMPSIGLSIVETGKWGGVLLTTIIGVTGIVGSLPIGILLALGRRSNMPIVRLLCVAFIEVIRGVPLITILFMASNMLPLFVPAELNPDKVARALIMVTLFASAYMAEVIRGGLQAIPKGQYEAAQALGLGYWNMTRLIILPQALRITVPGIVNTFIGLYKDTSLVSIIGLFDLLLSVRTAVRDGAWIGFSNEVYAFAAAFYFLFCFGMSRYSLYVEKRLNVGTRRS